MNSWRTQNEDETREVGIQLVGEVGDEATVLLFGDLGAGKTTLVQGIAIGLGFDPSVVQSPSYTLIHEYRTGERLLVHVDLYRLEPSEVLGLGLEEILAGPGFKVVEWAERLPMSIDSALRLDLRRTESGSREINQRF